jgi:hypothetical protein
MAAASWWRPSAGSFVLVLGLPLLSICILMAHDTWVAAPQRLYPDGK